jgi:hypothetical protein
MTDPREESALILLRYMCLIREAALKGDPAAQPYLDAGAIRVVDGEVEFHKDIFLAEMSKSMDELR